MKNIFVENPGEAITKFVFLLLPGLSWIEAFYTGNFVTLPVTIIVSTFILINTNKKLYIQQRYLMNKLSKCFSILSIVFLCISLVAFVFTFRVDLSQLAKVIDSQQSFIDFTEEFSKVLSEDSCYIPQCYIEKLRIVVSDIFDSRQYTMPLILYFLSFISYALECYYSIKGFFNSGNTNDSDNFDVTIANVN